MHLISSHRAFAALRQDVSYALRMFRPPRSGPTQRRPPPEAQSRFRSKAAPASHARMRVTFRLSPGSWILQIDRATKHSKQTK
jgi:hypothetical protein